MPKFSNTYHWAGIKTCEGCKKDYKSRSGSRKFCNYCMRRKCLFCKKKFLTKRGNYNTQCCSVLCARSLEKKNTQSVRKTEEWKSRAQIKRKNDHLLRLYGIGFEDFMSLLKTQRDKCAICKVDLLPAIKSRGAHIDHDHQTQKVRGILCNKCNLGLGMFCDDINKVKGAVLYLKRSFK